MARMGKLTPAKARAILHDGSVRGHPLTKKQRGFMGARASSLPQKSVDSIKRGLRRR